MRVDCDLHELTLATQSSPLQPALRQTGGSTLPLVGTGDAEGRAEAMVTTVAGDAALVELAPA